MADIAVPVAILLLVAGAVYLTVRRGGRLVAKRGLSIGADIGALSDAPRVRIHTVAQEGPDRVRLLLIPDADSAEHPSATTETGRSDLNFLVALGDDEFGYQLLHEWNASDRVLGIVLPPGGRLIRLRAVDDLQHLTLRRAAETPSA